MTASSRFGALGPASRTPDTPRPPTASRRSGRRDSAVAAVLLVMAAAGMLLFLLTGCAATVEAHRLATGDGPPAYELRGASLAALDAQVQQLCPHGHSTVREWEHVAADDGSRLDRLRVQALTSVRAVTPDQAQMTVQCKAAG